MSTEIAVYRTQAAAQTVKGTPATAPTRAFRTVTGNIAVNRDVGSENVGDGTNYTMFPDIVDWVNSVVGGPSAIGMQLTCDEAAWIMRRFNGAETVTANVEKATLNDHVTQPGATNPDYLTFWEKEGLSVTQRLRHNDCLITQVQIEGSTANKALRITPTILSLDPAQFLTADPTWVTMPTADQVMLWTEAASTFTVDGVVFRGQSQYTITLNRAGTPVLTDDVVPQEVQWGTPEATVAGTFQADADAQTIWNKYVYGTATPANNAKPTRSLPALGSWSAEHKKGAATTLVGRFRPEAAGVRWAIPEWPGPNPDGGNPTLTFTGGMRLNGVNPLWKMTFTSASPAFTT
jgi:hypothetical protein